LLVHRPGALRGHRLAGDHLAVDREREILERRVLREREDVVGLADRPAAVDVRLRHLVTHDAPVEIRAHGARRPNDARRPLRAERDARTDLSRIDEVALARSRRAWSRLAELGGGRRGAGGQENEKRMEESAEHRSSRWHVARETPAAEKLAHAPENPGE